MKRVLMTLTFLCAVAFLTGCTSYYKVTDPGTGRVYYTSDLDTRDNGAVRFTDAREGGTVTMQNSEVLKIDKTQFESAIGQK